MSDAVARGTLCPHCNRYYSRHIVVNGIIIFENKILLIKRGIEPAVGEWALPGGYLDWDESANEGAVREVYEETRVRGELVKFLGFYSDPERNSQNVSLIFQINALSNALSLQESEILDGKWFAPGEIPETLAFDHSKIVADFFKNNSSQV